MWIEVHQSLPRHPKLIRFASRLKIARPVAVGHLTCLWLWAMDYAPSGDLSRFDAAEIAAGAEWTGSSDELIEALISAGFVERETRCLHDWAEYGGKLHAKLEKDRERKRLKRAAELPVTSSGIPSDVQRISDGQEAPAVAGGEKPQQSGLSAGIPADVRRKSQVEERRGEENTEGERENAREGAQLSGIVNAAPAMPPPSMEEAVAFAARCGVLKECAENWFLTCDARGWVDGKGQPITKWHSSLLGYSKGWRNREGLSASLRRAPDASTPPPRPAAGQGWDPANPASAAY